MLSREEENWTLEDSKCKYVETSWSGGFGYGILWLFFPKKIEIWFGVANYIYVLDIRKGSGKEFFADLSHCMLSELLGLHWAGSSYLFRSGYTQWKDNSSNPSCS